MFRQILHDVNMYKTISNCKFLTEYELTDALVHLTANRITELENLHLRKNGIKLDYASRKIK